MLRIYLDKEALLEAGAIFDSKHYHFDNRKISVTEGMPYLYDGCLNYDPGVLVQFVVGASYYDNFGYGYTPHRQLGEYRLGRAVGELSEIGGRGSKDCHYHLKLQADSLKELRELYGLIREGQIWPAKDYEQGQVPSPARHLRQLLKEGWQLIRRDMHDRLYRIRDRVRASA